MRKFEGNSEIIVGASGDWREMLNDIVKHLPKLWGVSACGWYYPSNFVFIGSLEECLEYIGAKNYEEYTAYRKEWAKHTPYLEGFWGYDIEEIDIQEYIDFTVTSAVNNAKSDWEKKEHEHAQLLAQDKYKDMIKKCKEELALYVAEQVDIFLDKQ